MEEGIVGVPTPNIDSSQSGVHDHRKRKKDLDMADEQGAPKPKLKLDWTQTEEDVSVTTKLRPDDGEAEKVEVTFTEQELTITLADGSQQSWSLYAAIKKDQSRVQRKKRKFTITVTKQDAGPWPTLEAPVVTRASELPLDSPVTETQDMEACSAPETTADEKVSDVSPENDPHPEVRTVKEEEPVLDLQIVKHDFFEKEDSLTVHVYVKNVSKDAVGVLFENQAFTVKFQTCDAKFLQQHSGTTDETVFCWKLNTKHPIKPVACSHKVSNAYIELMLKKDSNIRWAGLEAIAKKETNKTTSWRSPAASSASSTTAVDGSAAAAESGSAVAFDEMSGVDANRTLYDTSDPLSASPKVQKPTAKVQPLNKQTAVTQMVTPGFTGLDNLGNTCFMNSVIQVLANTRELRDFFVGQGSLFQQDINRDNVLGTGGQLAISFGVLLRTLWQGTRYSFAPSKLKDIVAHNASQFNGYAQHDAQEFLAFLLDGLHEDLNRVQVKPYTTAVEDQGRPDHVVAEEAWEVYKKRNDSFIVDLLHGQYKSKLVCPVCHKVSITFDPFLYLSVPIPRQKLFTITFFWRDPTRRPVKMTVPLVKDTSVQHLKEVLSRKTGVHPRNMRVFEVYRSLILKRFQSSADLSQVQPNDVIMVSEVLSPELAGEEVVEVEVIQRTLVPHQAPTRCNTCYKECTTKLKRCTKCLKVGYCDQTCQRTNWQSHRFHCNQSPDPVGCPFYISLPKSQCTYPRISRLMESVARYSVDIFQPPVRPDIPPAPPTPTTPSPATVPTPTTQPSTTTTTTTTPFPTPTTTPNPQNLTPPPNELHLPSRSSASNLSSSSGSQSSGSLSSLDSISSCSSTATLTAETPHATFDLSPDGPANEQMQVDDDDKDCDESKGYTTDERGAGDVDSGCGSISGSETNSSLNSGLGTGDSGISVTDKSGSVQSMAASMTSAAERTFPLFFIKPVTAEGQGIREQGRLDDKGEDPLDMTQYRCLSMDWRNSDKQPSYVLVQSKPLDADTDPGYLKVSQGSWTTDTITLEQCLDLFTEPEILSPEEAWYCPSCKAHREASKTMSIWRLPHTLIIQLKRFSYRHLAITYREKIDKLVDFPIKGLDMSKYALGCPEDQPPPIYDLYGVVNHMGMLLGGHYTSYARCADPDDFTKNEVGWREFNDRDVTAVVNERRVNNRSAYLLFYRLRTPFVPPVPRPITQSVEEGVEKEEQKVEEEADNLKKDEIIGEEENVTLPSRQCYRDPVKMDDGEDSSVEKHDSEKDEDESDVDGVSVSAVHLDYTDMNAVD